MADEDLEYLAVEGPDLVKEQVRPRDPNEVAESLSQVSLQTAIVILGIAAAQDYDWRAT